MVSTDKFIYMTTYF